MQNQPKDPEFVTKKEDNRNMEEWINSKLIEYKFREMAGSLNKGSENPLVLFKLDR